VGGGGWLGGNTCSRINAFFGSVCAGGEIGRGLPWAWAMAGLRLPRGGVVQR